MRMFEILVQETSIGRVCRERVRSGRVWSEQCSRLARFVWALLVAVTSLLPAKLSWADEKSDCALAICQQECADAQLPFLDACLYCDIANGNCETEACITQFEGCLPGEICSLLYQEMVNGLCIQANSYAGCIQEKLDAGECCDVGTNTCCDAVECATTHPETLCTEAGACIAGSCEVIPKPDGQSCSDGVYCNGRETCSAGVCIAGTRIRCSDGDACNGVETCTQSGCIPGTPMDCDDGIACTEDSCSASRCSHAPQNSDCSGGLVCSPNLGCSGCGDGDVDAGEECDTSGASSSCNADCTLPMCGDGLANFEAGEECDGGDLAGETCESQGSATGVVGVLLCAECSFDTSACDADEDGVPDGEDVCADFDDSLDTDSDGTPDGCDVCPEDATDDSDGDGVCDGADLCAGFDDAQDTDSDGIPNGCDSCPADPANDSDADGVCDSADVCDGHDDLTDSDDDGVPDGCDACPEDAADDSDGDGVCDGDDVCPGHDDTVDLDGDGVPNGCDACPDDATDDSDDDGVCDGVDVCEGFDDSQDADGDGVPNGCDWCADSANDDSDGDGVCDSADICSGHDDLTDSDGDGVPDGCDECPSDADNDGDADGYCASDDCDDQDSNRNPDAPEICNDIDDDCDGKIDEALDCKTDEPEGSSGDDAGVEATETTDSDPRAVSEADSGVDNDGTGKSENGKSGKGCSVVSLGSQSPLGAAWLMLLLIGAVPRRGKRHSKEG